MKTATTNVAGVVEEVGVVTGKIMTNLTREEVEAREAAVEVTTGTGRPRVKKKVGPKLQRSRLRRRLRQLIPRLLVVQRLLERELALFQQTSWPPSVRRRKNQRKKSQCQASSNRSRRLKRKSRHSKRRNRRSLSKQRNSQQRIKLQKLSQTRPN